MYCWKDYNSHSRDSWHGGIFTNFLELSLNLSPMNQRVGEFLRGGMLGNHRLSGFYKDLGEREVRSQGAERSLAKL